MMDLKKISNLIFLQLKDLVLSHKVFFLKQLSRNRFRVNDISLWYYKKTWIIEYDNKRYMFREREWALAYIMAITSADEMTAEFILASSSAYERFISDKAIYQYYLDNGTAEQKKYAYEKIEIIDSSMIEIEMDVNPLVKWGF